MANNITSQGMHRAAKNIKEKIDKKLEEAFLSLEVPNSYCKFYWLFCFMSIYLTISDFNFTKYTGPRL